MAGRSWPTPRANRRLATWRLAFFIVAIPGPLIAIAVFLIGATRRIVTTAETPAPDTGAAEKPTGNE